MRLLALAVLIALLAPLPVSGQTVEPPVPVERLGPSAALWGARSCVGEAGWSSWAGECAAILHVYATRWEALAPTRPGLTYARVVRAYSSAVKRHELHRRPWIWGLSRSLSEPRAWPSSLSWERHRDDWGRLLAVAQAVLEGLTPSPCAGAQHFGNRTTDGRPRGHIRASCSIPTRNLFWRRAPR